MKEYDKELVRRQSKLKDSDILAQVPGQYH